MTRGFTQYDQWISRIKQRFAGTPIGASESIVSLWADTLGLDLRTPASFVNAISEGTEPTAADKATISAILATSVGTLLRLNGVVSFGQAAFFGLATSSSRAWMSSAGAVTFARLRLVWRIMRSDS